MNISSHRHIRQEITDDHSIVEALIKSTFADEEFSDHNEHTLVKNLRKSLAFIPQLSLVYEDQGEIVGHILLSKIKIVNKNLISDSLALAPVSVLPKYQNRGIGSKLIIRAHVIATQLGHQSIVVLGHKDYYPKFGYQQASIFGIKLPFDVLLENCMAIELVRNTLDNISGIVEYPSAFFE